MSENTEWIMRIQELHIEMTKLTFEAGVNQKIYVKLVRGLERRDADALWRILEFFEDTYRREYAEVLRVWTLPGLSEEIWQNYATMFSDTAFDEVKLLRHARKTLKGKYLAFWKNRPRRPRKSNTTSTDQTSTDGGLACNGDTRQ